MSRYRGPRSDSVRPVEPLSCSALLLRSRRDRLAGRARKPDDHLPGDAEIEADDASAEQTALLVEPGELHQPGLGGLLALRKCDGLARLEAEVPTPAADPGG